MRSRRGYPAALRGALISRYLNEADFMLALARKPAARVAAILATPGADARSLSASVESLGCLVEETRSVCA